MTDQGEHPAATERVGPSSPHLAPLGTWDFGRALIFYAFLIGGTIVLGVALLVVVGFKLSALLTELSLYLVLPFVLSRFLNTGWSSWMCRPRLALGSWVWMLLALVSLGVLVSNIPVAIDKVYPMSEEYREFFEVFLRADSTGGFLVILVVAALVPGICEEVTFRGLIQEGVRSTYGPRVAVAVTSVLFAVIHLSIWNFPALVLIGLFLGMLKEKTGSIWPGAVAHALNNTIALSLISIAPPSENAWQYEFFPFWVNAAAAAVFVLGLGCFLRRTGVQAHPAAQF